MVVMRMLLTVLSVLMMTIASGAVIQLIKDGGAINQGYNELVVYVGPLNYLPVVWELTVLGLFSYVIWKTKWRHFSIDYYWVSIFTLGVVASTWAPFPSVAVHSSISILLAYLFINLHVSYCGWRRIVSFLQQLFFGILVLSLGVIFLFPSYGVSIGDHAGRWQGVFAHKNSLGYFTSLILLFFLWKSTYERSMFVMISIAMSLLLIVRSESATAILNASISFLIYVAFRIKIVKYTLFLSRYFWIGLIVFVVCYTMIASLNGEFFLIFDKDSTFSSRDVIWLYFLNSISTDLWFGKGIGQFTSLLAQNSQDFLLSVGFVVGSAHNGYLETLFSLGVVGLGLVFIVLMRLLKLRIDNPFFELVLYFLINLVILNMFESMLLGFNVYFLIAMYLASVCRAIEAEMNLTRI